MSSASDSDKTEDPTGTKLDEARQKGDIAKSKEFSNFFVFLGCVVSLSWGGDRILKGIVDLFAFSFDFTQNRMETSDAFLLMMNKITVDMLMILAPFFIGVMIFALAGYFGQFGFLFTTEKLAPDFERMNLLSGLKRFITKETFVELIKSMAKVIAISAIMYLVFKGEAQKIIQLGSLPVQDIFRYGLEVMANVLYVVLIFLAVLGGLDLGFQKWNYWQKMKMSVQEVKDEMKNREGDPHIKARIRQIQRDRARARMMDEVPKANVVVTNPTHVAVALKYERGKMRAPVVVAKGAGYIAVKIKERAAEAGVPIMEKRELARFLYRNVEVNEMIPESLYTAVAEVLAYIHKIKKQFRSFIAQEAV